MDAAGLSNGGWSTRVGAGWRWWLEELAQMVPGRVREAFATSDDAVVIDVQPEEFVVCRRAGAFETVIARIPRDGFAARALNLAVPRVTGFRRWLADPVILQLPAGEALIRSMRLPAGARRNLADILRHEVVRQSPIAAQDIYYDYRIDGTSPGGLDVTLRILRREPIDELLRLCAEADIAVSAIAFAGDTARAGSGTFPVDAAAARELRRRPWIIPALAGLVLLLTILLIGCFYWRGASVADDLADRVDAARGGATTVEILQRRLDAANRQAAFLAQQKRNPAAVAVLATVARLLPDDAWLYEFELNGDEVRLHGFSTRAASLIALFDASPYFGEAQFRAPLMQGQTPGTQRFDISFKLRKAAT